MRLVLAALFFGVAVPAHAQPADLPIPAATTDQYPAGVTVRLTAAGRVYADAQGRTLYGMDMRTLIRWTPDPAKFCQSECAEKWQPLLAPANAVPNVMYPRSFGDRNRPTANPGEARPPSNPVLPGFVNPLTAPDWTVIAGPQGPQWVYKGWHVVYIRTGDAPGSTAYDGADQMTWNTLKFVPPVPKVTAPAGIALVLADGGYALADKSGRLLFTGVCKSRCLAWLPLAAPMASRGFGEWSVGLTSDVPQWRWRGEPVYISQEADPKQVPAKGLVLRP